MKSPIDVKQSIAASHTIVQTIKKMYLVLKNLKLNPALTLGVGFLEAFLLRLRRAWEGLSTTMFFTYMCVHLYNGFTYMRVQWGRCGRVQNPQSAIVGQRTSCSSTAEW